jgi:hypothetical protein
LRKFVYFLIALGMIIWLGGSVVRNVVIFDIFIPAETLTLKPDYIQDVINYNIYLFTATSLYTSISYGVMFLLFVVLTYIERNNFRREGWLLMSIILFFLTSPVVIYNIYSDYLLSILLFNVQTPNHVKSFELIMSRYSSTINTVLSGISYLAGLNIVAYAVFKPLVNEIDNKQLSNETS